MKTLDLLLTAAFALAIILLYNFRKMPQTEAPATTPSASESSDDYEWQGMSFTTASAWLNHPEHGSAHAGSR